MTTPMIVYYIFVVLPVYFLFLQVRKYILRKTRLNFDNTLFCRARH